MIGTNIQAKLDGLVLTAFQIYCVKRSCLNSGEGIRTMVRELPEFLEIQVARAGVSSKEQGENGHFAHRLLLRLSRRKWKEFEAWYKQQGCQSIDEGVRLAVHNVTESKENNICSDPQSAVAG